jgi:hypothetical protein
MRVPTDLMNIDEIDLSLPKNLIHIKNHCGDQMLSFLNRILNPMMPLNRDNYYNIPGIKRRNIEMNYERCLPILE